MPPGEETGIPPGGGIPPGAAARRRADGRHLSDPPADLAAAVEAAKAELRAGIGDVEGCYRAVLESVGAAVAEVAERRAAGGSAAAVPVIEFARLSDGRLDEKDEAAVRASGCAVVRGTVDPVTARRWDAELAGYLEQNRFGDRYRAPAAGFFEGFAQALPMIYPIYWSRPQVEARQHEHLAAVRSALNSVWQVESEGRRWFEPDRDCTFADRIRRRRPGDSSGGLAPHLDAGSVERWLLPAYRSVYRHLYAGFFERHDPFDAAYRPLVDEYEAAETASVFRTYQGWVALSAMAGEGTLELVPIASAIALVLLRPLRGDVAGDDLCGAGLGRGLSVSARWHEALLPALTAIPPMEPGDTVWWHPDVVHGVGAVASATAWSNVMYVPASPFCEKNADSLPAQLAAFLTGASPPDYPAEHYEADFTGRATLDDLTPLGRRQMGVDAW